MGFRGVKPLADAMVDGWNHDSFIFKSNSPVRQNIGHWADWSMGAGTPKYNAYVGVQFESTPLYGSGNFGIYSGGNIAPATKHLKEICMGSADNMAPAVFQLCDYLMFYPLIDCDSTDVQLLDNVASLPRYVTGDGVELMIVCTTPQAQNATITINYTNSLGQQKVTNWPLESQNVGCLQGSTLFGATHGTPFVWLAQGDTGIRSIESVQLNSGSGGFISLVLVRPLAPFTIREQNTYTETDYLFMRPSLRRIFDGAYLNFIYKSSLNNSTALRGNITFVGA